MRDVNVMFGPNMVIYGEAEGAGTNYNAERRMLNGVDVHLRRIDRRKEGIEDKKEHACEEYLLYPSLLRRRDEQ